MQIRNHNWKLRSERKKRNGYDVYEICGRERVVFRHYNESCSYAMPINNRTNCARKFDSIK